VLGSIVAFVAFWNRDRFRLISAQATSFASIFQPTETTSGR